MKLFEKDLFASARTLLLSTLACATLVSSLAGCKHDPVFDGESNVIDLAKIRNSNLNAAEKAEKFAEAAEKILTPSGFIYVDHIVSEALTFDAKNPKARLIKAVIAPAMMSQGLGKRTAPIYESHPRWAQEYKTSLARAKKLDPAVQPTVSFWLNGPEDIRDERDLQEFIASVTVKLDELRTTLRDLKDENITLYVKIAPFQRKGIEEQMKTCQVMRLDEDHYKIDNCNSPGTVAFNLNRADFEILQQMVASQQVLLTIANNWKFTNALQVARSHAEPGDPVSREQILRELLQDSDFATIRENHGLGVVPEATKDFVLAVRYAVELQDQLCKEVPEGNTRPGYLFNKGFCVRESDALSQRLAAVEAVLNGTPMDFDFEKGPLKASIQIDGRKFYEDPMTDLRELLPARLAPCGRVQALSNGTAGGVFPEGGLNVWLALNAAQACASSATPQQGTLPW